MNNRPKKDFPVEKIRRFLEPGPIVLVSSFYQGETNIMTMGWHTVMEFSPSLVGCIISNANHSFDMIRKSKECVINIPEVRLAQKVVEIGNTSGSEIDKFEKFKLTSVPAKKVKAPLIQECFAHFECRVVDQKLVKKYNFFILEVVKAEVATSPKFPKTIHYRGDTQFMISGRETHFRTKITGNSK